MGVLGVMGPTISAGADGPIDDRRDRVETGFAEMRAPFAPRVIYGNDDRIEAADETDPMLRELADAACLVVDLGELADNGDGTFTLATEPWTNIAGVPLCEAERFAGQPQLGYCSGWFAGDDVVVTAGLCVTQGDVGLVAVVFGFRIDELSGDAPVIVSADDVYTPIGIINAEVGGGYDHAVVQVDRPIAGRNPAPIMRTVGPNPGTPLAAIGHPVYLPTKIGGGGEVQAVLGADTYFQANLDSYAGSTGSMVVNLDTYEVAGVIARGAPDWTSGDLCTRSNTVPDSGNTGGGPVFEEVSQSVRFAPFVPTLGLLASPGAGPTHVGVVGGPFDNDPVVYTLRNVSDAPVDYEVRLGDATGLLLLDGGSAPIAGSLAPGGNTDVLVTLDASAASLPAGVQAALIEFEDLTLGRTTTRTHTIETGQTLVGVVPTEPFVTGGTLGGPYNDFALFEITNERPTPVTVRAEASESWITIDGGAGPVDTALTGLGDSAILSIEIGPDADALPEGAYFGQVTFTNQTDLTETTIDVVLEAGRFVDGVENPTIIQDNTFVRSTTTADGSFCIADVDVDLAVSHASPSDLLITLTSPEGTTVALHDHGASDPSGRYDGGVLDALVGASPQGVWTLTVVDDVSGVAGVLESWSIRLGDDPQPCAPIADSVRVAVPANRFTPVELSGASRTGGSLVYTIVSLPTLGRLFDDDGAIISNVPYVLPDRSRTVRYRPRADDAGADSFGFTTDDGQTSDIATVSLDVGIDQPITVFELGADPGWTTDGGWAFGAPAGLANDPDAGVGGDNVYGYNLNGAYPIDMPGPEYLTTTPIDCTGYADVGLRFARWLGVERSEWDLATIEVSNDDDWDPVWNNPFDSNIIDAFWSRVEYDLSPTADDEPDVRIRWGLGPTDEVTSLAGWNIDEVSVVGTPPLPQLADLTTQNAPVGDPLYGKPDGIVSGADLFFYVGLWLDQSARADLSTPNAPVGDPLYGMPDGTITGVDLSFYVNVWFATN
jgi:subtilisin-like proprotein convertase family protein